MLLPTTKLTISNFSVSRLGSVFPLVTRNETKSQKILDTADFVRRENCSVIRLNDAFPKTLLKVAKKKKKKTLRQPTMRAEFSLIRALISN